MCGQQPHGWTKAGGSSSMSTGLVKADQTTAEHGAARQASRGTAGTRGLSLCSEADSTHPRSAGQAPPGSDPLGGPAEALSPLSRGLVHCFRCRVHRKVQGSSWRPEGPPCCSPSDHHPRGTAQFPFLLPLACSGRKVNTA